MIQKISPLCAHRVQHTVELGCGGVAYLAMSEQERPARWHCKQGIFAAASFRFSSLPSSNSESGAELGERVLCVIGDSGSELNEVDLEVADVSDELGDPSTLLEAVARVRGVEGGVIGWDVIRLCFASVALKIASTFDFGPGDTLISSTRSK
jgi:hypothetical protein